ncbi:pre-mRNA-splicing factor prp46, partial [Coemansia aciculifera]
MADSPSVAYPVEPLARAVVHGTNSLFQGTCTPSSISGDTRIKSRTANIATKYRDEYASSRDLPRGIGSGGSEPSTTTNTQAILGSVPGGGQPTNVDEEVQRVLDGLSGKQLKRGSNKKAKQPTRDLVLAAAAKASRQVADGRQSVEAMAEAAGQQLVRKRHYEPVKPSWHAPWRLMRVISGHIGWVRSLAVEPGNKWFASGSVDRTIKIWDLASGTLKLTLTGHISPVRGLAVSARHPYLFSGGEDKQVKCWDLETNKVVRQYHGHLSGVYALALHP